MVILISLYFGFQVKFFWKKKSWGAFVCHPVDKKKKKKKKKRKPLLKPPKDFATERGSALSTMSETAKLLSARIPASLCKHELTLGKENKLVSISFV